jgi:uncharacterized coiled-coil protein SlyX
MTSILDGGTIGIPTYNPNRYDGLIVYNIGTGAIPNNGMGAGTVSPGFYYYSNPDPGNGNWEWDSGTWRSLGAAGTGLTRISGNGDPRGSDLADGGDDSPSGFLTDVYIDEDTGNIWVHNGTTWIQQTGGVVTRTGAGDPRGGNPTDGSDDSPSGNQGDVYTDNSTGDIYVHNGTTWLLQSGGVITHTGSVDPRGSSIVNPMDDIVSGNDGDVYINEITGETYVHDGATWQPAGASTLTGSGDPRGGNPTDGSDDSPSGNQGDVYTDNSTGDIYVHNGTTWVQQTGNTKFVDGTNPNNAVYTTGNVGIGTNAPNKPLHVVSDDGVAGTMRIQKETGTDGNGEVGIGLYPHSTNDTNRWMIAVGSWGNNGDLIFGDNAARVAFQKGGNVGIGTTEPGAFLDISGRDGAAIEFDDGDSFITVHDNFGNFNIKTGVDADNKIVAGAGGSHIRMQENGEIRFMIDESTIEGEDFLAGLTLRLRNDKVSIEGGGFQLQDNGAGLGKILTSDANGNATWQDVPSFIDTNTNLANTNLALSGDRTHSLGNNHLRFNLNGSGDFRIQDNGTTKFEVFDNGDIAFGGTAFYMDDSNKRIGFGTSSPTRALDIASGGFRLQGNGAGVNKVLTSDANGNATWQDAPSGGKFVDGTNTADAVYTTGNVGIGTNAPNKPLHIVSDNGSNGTMHIRRATGTGTGEVGIGLFPHPTDNTNRWLINVGASGHSGDLVFYNGSGPQVLFEAGGNVGLGTTDPTTKLHVNGGFRLQGNGAANGRVLTSDASGNATWQNVPSSTNTNFASNNLTLSGTRTHQLGNHNLLFNLNGSGDFRILDSGVTKFEVFDNGNIALDGTSLFVVNSSNRVGIGTNTPDKPLHIVSDDGSSGTMRLQRATGTGSGEVGIGLYPHPSSDTNRWLINVGASGNSGDLVFYNGTGPQVLFEAGGDVGIGTTNPQAKLHVNGEIIGTRVKGSSDARFKKKVTTLPNVLERLQKVRGVSYFWKTEAFKDRNFTKEKEIGVIAQELEKAFPELVSYDDKGYRMVNYLHLAPVLLQAINEQQKLIEKLRGELTAQTAEANKAKTDVASLTSRIETIEKLVKAKANTLEKEGVLSREE